MSQNPNDITEKAYLAYQNKFGHPPSNATQLNKFAKGCGSQFIGVTWKTSSSVIKNPPCNPPIRSNTETDNIKKSVADLKKTSNNNNIIINSDNDMNNVSNKFAPAQIPQNNKIQNDKQPTKRGLLFFQTKFITKEQMEHIKTINIDTNPKFLFGDNDIDNARSDNISRKHHYGHSMGVNVLCQYDRSFGYGIVVTFHNTARPAYSQFKQLTDFKFQYLQQHLINGNDVIIFEPTNIKPKDKYKYFRYGKQIIYHTIGSDIENFPMQYSQYIETKIRDLRNNYSRKIASGDYYKYTAPKTVNEQNRWRDGYKKYNAPGRGDYNRGRGRYNPGRGRYNKRYRGGRGAYNNQYGRVGGHKSYNNPSRGGFQSYNNNGSQKVDESQKVMELQLKLKEYEMKEKHNEEMQKEKKKAAALQRKVQKLQESGGIINVWEMQKNNGQFLRYDKTSNDNLEKLAISGSYCYSHNGQQYKITKTSMISGFQINTAYPEMKRTVRRIQMDAAASFGHNSGPQMSENDAKQKTLEIRKKIPCKFGDDCKHFKKGKCEFLHEQPNIKEPDFFQKRKGVNNNDNEEYENEGNQEGNDEEGSVTAYV